MDFIWKGRIWPRVFRDFSSKLWVSSLWKILLSSLRAWHPSPWHFLNPFVCLSLKRSVSCSLAHILVAWHLLTHQLCRVCVCVCVWDAFMCTHCVSDFHFPSWTSVVINTGDPTLLLATALGERDEGKGETEEENERGHPFPCSSNLWLAAWGRRTARKISFVK